MVTLKPHRVDRVNNNTPVLFNNEIDAYAHAILADYKPELLQEASIINYEHFLESYLGMRIDFQDLYSDDPERPILAMTAFRRCKVRVFDKENECVEKITVPARTVIIDNSLLKQGRECLALFSALHEGGHITMHWHVYTGETLDGREYDADCEFSDELFPYVCCRRKILKAVGVKTKSVPPKNGESIMLIILPPLLLCLMPHSNRL